jgi:glycerol kinase
VKHILALDQGTTSSRAIIFDEGGDPIIIAQREFTQIFPQPGWVEHDPKEIWATQHAVALEALQQLRDQHGARSVEGLISALAITNQRETIVVWDRVTGQPIANAIVWQDHRTTDWCDELKAEGFEECVRAKTGLLLDAYFSATKIRWLLDSVPGARDRAEAGLLACGTIDSWLVWNLTAGEMHITDVSNASRTMLFNIHKMKWDEQLLDLFGIPASILPVVVPSSGVVAATHSSVLGITIPIAGIAGDQQAATFGQACFEPGMAKNTYGTGCFMLMNTGLQPVESRSRLLTTIGWNTSERKAAPVYCLEGAVFMAGATVQWLRDGLQIIQTPMEIESLAAQVNDTGDVYLVPAFSGLGAPYWDGHARGTLVGMSRGTGRPHLARAALEAIALQTVDVFEAMSQDSRIPLRELRVDGGASRNNMLMQMQADFLGVTVVRPKVTETTALGAAYLAGLAIGMWRSAQEVSSMWKIDRKFEPTYSADQRAEKLRRWRKAVERARNWTE